jgi:hypothetical protein
MTPTRRELYGLTLLWALVLAYALLALGCVTVPTRAGIARDLAAQLDTLSTWPLSTRCQAIRDAERRCIKAGFEPRCFADGWNDRDRDAWTLAACQERKP